MISIVNPEIIHIELAKEDLLNYTNESSKAKEKLVVIYWMCSISSSLYIMKDLDDTKYISKYSQSKFIRWLFYKYPKNQKETYL